MRKTDLDPRWGIMKLHISLFVLTLLLGVTQVYAEEAETNSVWSVERTTDPILDTTNITAQLLETGAKNSLFADDKYLVVRCKENELDAFVVWGRFMALGFSLFENNDVEVIVRVGSNEAKKENWSKSTSYNAAFAPNAESFIRSLKAHPKLAVRTFPDDGGSLTAVFDLSEAKPIFEEVLEACHK